VLRLTWDTLVYYYVRDAVEEPRRWLLQMACADVRLSRTQQALLDVGLLIVGEAPERQDPVSLLDGAIAVFDDEGLSLEAAVARHWLGLHLWQAGLRERAVGALEEASHRYAALQHDWGAAMVGMTLGAARAGEGEQERARAHFQEALARARRIENRPQTAQSLQGIALAEAFGGCPGPALEALRESVGLVLTDRSLTGSTYCLEALGAVRLAEGRPGDAVRLVSAARAARERRMIPVWTAAADTAEQVLEEARRTLPPDTFWAHWLDGQEASADVFALLENSLEPDQEAPGWGDPVASGSG
jgi:tetratricopeptide (TPR) repeat protein